ncbi:MAG: hypothetical protein NT018_04380 [Armatimonadetes bacterium]|nr:hypothetical protein [Armatimonadota bacterium]
MKIRLLFVSLIIMLSAFGASAEEAAKDQAKCFTTWDENYLYLAVKVDSPDIIASHKFDLKNPTASVGDDDSVTLYIETAGKRPEKIDISCASFVVSPAGGFQFCVGMDGKLEPKKVLTCKYGINLQGTINNSDDIDMNYSIEMAIPWDVLYEAKPAMGNITSFNVIIRKHNGGFVSIAPRVKMESDILSPAKWSKLVLAPYSFATATMDREKIVSSKYVVRPPLINGVISEKEWNANTSFLVDLPMPEGVVYETKFPAQKVALADYFFWGSPAGKSDAANEPAISLVDFPIRGAGPWVGYDRTQYHKEELADIVTAGIDVVMGHVSAEKKDRVGMLRLISAIDELKAEGKAYPLIGMNLSLPANQAADNNANYKAIKDFFSRVPLEYRAMAQASKPINGQRANVVKCLSNPVGFAEYCANEYEKDFGSSLVFPQGVSGSIRIDSVSRISGNNSPIATGAETELYNSKWDKAIADNLNWIVCDSWNNLQIGSELCATREYGRKFIDSTAANVKKFRGGFDYDALFVRYNVPSVIPGKQISTAEIEIRNVGNMPWRVTDSIALGYRWYRNGRYFSESKVRRPLERDVMPGETIKVNLGIATIDSRNAAIPNGEAAARIELIRLSDGKWFSAFGDQALVVPITIGAAPQWAATWLSGHLPPMMGTGQSYRTLIRVRNDGSQPWPKGLSKLGCKLFKVQDDSGEAAAVPIKDCSALLTKECKSGEIAEFAVNINLIGADKKPLPIWSESDNWSYSIGFDIYNGQKWLSELGVSKLVQTVAIYEKDTGPRIVACGLESKLKAGQTLDTKVVLRNAGKVIWDRKKTKIGYHWYHLDGSEMLWDGIATPLTANVEPGLSIVTTAKVTTPEQDDQYVLVWDLMIDGIWQSTLPLNRGGNTLPVFIEVSKG